jgi:hypothetical protein
MDAKNVALTAEMEMKKSCAQFCWIGSRDGCVKQRRSKSPVRVCVGGRHCTNQRWSMGAFGDQESAVGVRLLTAEEETCPLPIGSVSGADMPPRNRSVNLSLSGCFQGNWMTAFGRTALPFWVVSRPSTAELGSATLHSV